MEAYNLLDKRNNGEFDARYKDDKNGSSMNWCFFDQRRIGQRVYFNCNPEDAAG
jgi:hypothetical protein